MEKKESSLVEEKSSRNIIYTVFGRYGSKDRTIIKSLSSQKILCSYCNNTITNHICEDCLLTASNIALTNLKINPLLVKNVFEKLQVLKAPDLMKSDFVCSLCNINEVSICNSCYYDKFEGVFLEEKKLFTTI